MSGMLAGDALGLFDQLLDSSSSSLLDETARLSSQGVDGLALGGKDDDMHINMEDDEAVMWKTDQDGGGGGGGTTSDADLLESILTGSEVGTMLNLCNDDDLDFLSNNGSNNDNMLSSNSSSSGCGSDDGMSDSGSSSSIPPAASPISIASIPSPQPPTTKITNNAPFEVITHTVPTSVRPLRVVKPTVVTLNNTIGCGGVEPIRILTTKSPQNVVTTTPQSLQTATTTIVLPVMSVNSGRQQHAHVQLPSEPLTTSTMTTTSSPNKRRRTSASSSDSGLDETSSTTSVHCPAPSKYPPLVLNEEEKRLCEREGVRLPSHYPLSREEERNLKRIRRKIRNKVSAQDSRKRKKEYVDAMEDRVKQCTVQNEELNKKIQLLESQNRTLSGQLRRLHQIIVNGGLKNAVASSASSANTSTAMMVLLLSTALFLLPGFKDSQSQESKCSELDISQAIKMPPMPGQSRSLLHFAPVKQEFEGCPANAAVKTEEPAVANAAAAKQPQQQLLQQPMDSNKSTAGAAVLKAGVKRPSPSSSPDHDYFGEAALGKKSMLLASAQSWRNNGASGANTATNHSYIEEDAPPKGYGPDKSRVVLTSVEERMVNVTNTGGIRTVVLKIPRDIK